MRIFATTCFCILWGGFVFAQTCGPFPEPIVSLHHGSRYTDDSISRSEISEKGNAEVNAALEPIDQFQRDLVRLSNSVLRGGSDQLAKADCVVKQLAIWARAEALSDLSTITANFSVGSRLAGFAFIYRQVAPYSADHAGRKDIEDWLGRRANEQMTFWEEDATPGAKLGNLRAWATLAINLIADLRNDPVALRWSEWSATLLLCQANEDGSLPQEMRRGKYALHYQLHAVAPLVLTSLLLDQQDRPVAQVCDNALDRIVAFTLTDLATGQASERISGKTQSFFDGTSKLKSFHLAWLEAYLLMEQTPQAKRIAEMYRPFSHSKLGGNQLLVWGRDGL